MVGNSGTVADVVNPNVSPAPAATVNVPVALPVIWKVLVAKVPPVIDKLLFTVITPAMVLVPALLLVRL